MKNSSMAAALMPVKLISICGRKKVNPFEVIMLEGEINYTKIYLISGKILFVAKTLKNLLDRLGEDSFFRTHKSYIVNLTHIKNYEFGEEIRLLNDLTVQVSRRKKEAFCEKLVSSKRGIRFLRAVRRSEPAKKHLKFLMPRIKLT